jgi:hypothetical protein
MPAAIELDDAEKGVLMALLKNAIATDPFPSSPRIRVLRRILVKLAPPPPRPQPHPAPKATGDAKRDLGEKEAPAALA